MISDYEVTEKMLKYFISKAMGKRAFRKPRVSICVPSSVTEVEKKAVEEATYRAGARDAVSYTHLDVYKRQTKSFAG